MPTPDEIRARIVAKGEEWVEADHAANLLEETRKAVRAQLAMMHMLKANSVAKAELLAEADDRYEAHIRAMVDARKLANLARVHFEGARTWSDHIRTQESTKRAEMNLR